MATTTAPVPTPAPKVASTTTASPTKQPVLPSAISFAGKTVTIVVPTAAGGGADVTSRIYARYLPKYLPGNPSVIVRNMPGGAGTLAGNYVYLSAKPDGLTVLAAASSVLYPYVVGMSAARYDFQKMDAVIGRASGLFYVTKPNIARSVEELPKAREIVFGGTPGGAPAWIFISATKLLDVTPRRVVLAYGSGGEARRAFLSGEINTTSETVETYPVMAEYVAKGEVLLLFQSGILNEKGELVRDTGLPVNIPTANEAYEKINGKPPSGIPWDVYKSVVAAGRNYQSLLLTPPGTPESILRTWWGTAQSLTKDPGFRKLMDPSESSPWGVGEAYSRVFKANMAIDPKAIEWLKVVLTEYGLTLE